MTSTSSSTRRLVLVLLVVSLGLLIPGLFAPVLTIRGVLTRDGIAQVAPMMLEKGLNDDTLNALKAMMNPTVVGLLEATGGDLRQMIIDKVTPSLTASLQQSVGRRGGVSADAEYCQLRAASVRSRQSHTGDADPAVQRRRSIRQDGTRRAGPMFAAQETRRRKTLAFVEAIAKWSMADVFVVALFITYLAAMASQSTPVAGPPLVAFIAEFGAGFYWFAAYCVFSLASQQLTARVLAARV